MKTETHTAGPWHVNANESFGEIVLDSQKRIVARAERGFADTEANARLIAAAPELLEELTDALDILQSDLMRAIQDANGSDAFEEPLNRKRQRIRRIRETITKAGGNVA